jgi:predicted MFS family arabinose efflux permease
MTHRFAYTEHLPTLALVELGASEAIVGLQRMFEPLGQVLQFPTLRAVGRFRKRSILVVGQLIAFLAGLPLVAFGLLASSPQEPAVLIVLASLAVTAVGIVIAQTVWFPMLRGYVEPDRIGVFFGLLRMTWHVTLIVYFVAAQRWLAARPGAFGLLFGVAAALGLLRLVLVTRLPEAKGEVGKPVRIREALGLLRTNALLRRYLAGVALAGAARRAVIPFAIVLMRRVLGLSDAEVLLATVGFLTGGLVSLYPWGRIVDRFGPVPVFRTTAVGMALVFGGLLGVNASDGVAPMVSLFFALAVLSAGFGVADTHVLFGLAPPHAPTPVFVVSAVVSSLAYGLAPFAAGIALESALESGVDPLSAYRGLFVTASVAVVLALIPLQAFRRLGS